MHAHDDENGLGKDKHNTPVFRNGGDPPATPKSRVVWALTVSGLIHALVIVIMAVFLKDDVTKRKADALQVWLSDKPDKIKSDPIKPDKKLVVAVYEPSQTPPKQADYLAENNSSTTQEKQAPLKRGQKPLNINDHFANHSAPPTNPNDLPSQNHLLDRQKRKHVGKVDKNDPLNLRPNLSDDHVDETSGSLDHFANMDVGDKTELNAWQWRHAPFFNRIKERIGQIWAPQTQIARYDPQGHLLGQVDRVTVLQITIDRQGKLRNLSITNQSGVSYLDEEAERAFRVAAPFLFPPQELFAEKDEFSFTFAFHLYLNRGFSLGFEWQNE